VELIAKPFTQAALASKLRDILDAKRVPGRILLVEDEPLIQMLATEYLEEAGFSVDWAGSALEAINKIGRVPGGVEAAVVDIGLPDRQGDVLIRELKALYPTLPIVLATGQDTTELARMLRPLEKIVFLAKPYSATDLLRALDSLGVRGKSAESGSSARQ
jgi:DNA-binding response OmpR family regulator